MTKHRGTVAYHIVYAALVEATRGRSWTTYQQLAERIGLPSSGSHMGKKVGDILDEITHQEIEEGRSLLSVLCVGTSGIPGPGFYDLAKRLGRPDHTSSSSAERRAYWDSLREEVYKEWYMAPHASRGGGSHDDVVVEAL